MSNIKQEVEQLLNKLPDDCSVEDIQYHLFVLDKVRRAWKTHTSTAPYRSKK
jgi:hypothetical protein